jgi:hypothetical protein
MTIKRQWRVMRFRETRTVVMMVPMEEEIRGSPGRFGYWVPVYF